ncbi:MAG: hypothetical protein WCR54_04800 [Clostridia bacterium]
MAELFAKEKLIEMEEMLVGLGPRLTGSQPHIDYINFLEKELISYGYEIGEDDNVFNKWEPKDYSLNYESNEGNIIEVDKNDISYYPYSGQTEEEGVTAPMKWCGKEPINSFMGSLNKIAVVSMPIFEADCGLVFKKREVYPSDFIPPQKQGSPVVSTFVIAPVLKHAKKAGAKAVICVMTGCSDDLARHQYLPFITTYAGIPSLWVTESVGKEIIEAAQNGKNATLKLTANYGKDAHSRTIYAVLKGQNPNQSILVNTHTDGSNAFEENAGIGLLSLAKYFSEKPIEERNRNLVFSFVTGHFQLHQFGNALNQATTRFLNVHPEFWDGEAGNYQAIAGLTMEHLGCSEWRDDEKHENFIKLDDTDPELVYTSNEIMSRMYIDCIKDRKYVKALMLRPKNMVHFGEGQPIYKKGIPSISLCPGPDYLCNVAPNGYIDKINYDMMAEQIDTFRKLIELLDTKKREELGFKQKFNFGIKF